ncbi:cytochrome P450 [Periconia macrospinosa]|uniref:Cytochrome P450 n=1 Tax=Periconia macrospinosa TaxID=97972 RepID=A0A2V1E6B5_9PLEO|nr:cytochrome P450 [Periconia macrospinosa]
MLPIRELHYDSDFWGADTESLNPKRFVNSNLSKSHSYRPWGGGHTLCPGRHLARRSANIFVAILLCKYNVTVESSRFPKSDGARPSPGVVTVGQGEDLKLRLMPRKSPE